jgi:hypothetical protein
MTNAYVYKITNNITNEFYYGYRYKNQSLKISPNNDLWVRYFTSSKRVKKDIDKYGKRNFTVEIIYEDIDSLECWRKEQILIKENWKNELLLNQSYQDPESDIEIRRRTNRISKEARRKMSIAATGRKKSDEHKRKIALANTGKVGSIKKRQKISEARKGKATNRGVSPPKYECRYCNKIVSKGNLTRWHNENCKSIDPEGHKIRSKQVSEINKKS